MNNRLIVLALTACLTLIGCESPEQKEADYIRRGNALFDKGELDKARVEYKNAARIKPTDAEPLYRLGLIDEEQGDLRNAFAGFSAAEQQDSHFHPAILKIAQYYLAAERFDETQQRINSVLSDAPDDPEGHAILAGLLLRQKDFAGAEKEAQFALSKDADNISAYSALTGVYSAEDKFDAAAATVNEGIARHPKNLSLLMLRVLLYEHMNNLPKVAEAYQAIFELKPDETRFRVDLASIYIEANKLDEAEAVLRGGITASPDNWDLRHRLVLFLGEYRSADAAEKEIKDLMHSYPKNDDLYFWLADLYADHDATDKAVALLNEVIDHGQFDASALNARNLLARINMKRGNKELAQKLVATILAKAPDNRDALLIRATLAFTDGYYQSAVADLRTIIRDKPQDPEALQLLSETLLLQGHLDLAIDTMKKLADLDITNMAVRVRLAQMINMNDDNKQAVDLVAEVTKVAPTYAVGWETAARLAIDAKEWLPAEAAVKELDKIDGQHLTAVFLEGRILDLNGKSEDALNKYMEVINADPTTPLAERALTTLVDTDQKLGRMDTATSYIETLKSDSPFVMTMLGKCYAAIGKLEQSAAAFDKAIASGVPLPDPYLDRAELYLNDHQTDAAIEVLKKGTAAVPSDFRAPMKEALLLSDNGKYQDAVVLYEDMLARNPSFDPAANNLAEVIADNEFGDPTALEKARQTAERFSDSNNPLLLDTLAWVYFRQGNMAAAQTIIERAMAFNAHLPPQVHFHYGAILAKVGKTDQAKAELKQATDDGTSYAGIDEAKRLLNSL